MKAQLLQLITGNSGRLSTTNGIQLIITFTLCAGFFLSIAYNREVTAELAYALAFVAFGTPATKGYMDYKRECLKDHDHAEDE